MKLYRILPGLSVLAISCSLALPVQAQQDDSSQLQNQGVPAASTISPSTSSAASSNDSATYATGAPLAGQSNEGFWGKMNPFARKKWVNRQVQPIRDRENELDQLSAKNANDIKDVDARAQAGIHNAMMAANTADQHAADAADRANAANTLAANASSRTDALNTTVTNLDQYTPINSKDVPFARGRTALGPQGRSDLDDVATQLQGQKGYIVEVQAFSRSGIAASQAMADSVARYLVTEHQIPVYRIYKVGMGKQVPAETETASNDTSNEPIEPITNGVRVTLLHNSLATMDNGSQPVGSQSSTAQPDNQFSGQSSNTAAPATDVTATGVTEP